MAEYRDRFPNAELQDEATRRPGRTVSKELRKQISKRMKARRADPSGSFGESYRKKMSASIKKFWDETPASKIDSRISKARQTNYQRGNWIRPENKSRFDAYRDEVRRLSEREFRAHYDTIVNSHLRSVEYELDHRFSIFEGFRRGIDPVIISHHMNLHVIDMISNRRKGKTCSISYEELAELIVKKPSKKLPKRGTIEVCHEEESSSELNAA